MICTFSENAYDDSTGSIACQTETAEIVDGDVRVMEEQAAKPQPKGAIILAKLEGITKLLAAAAGTAVAAEKLLPYAQKAVEMAGQLFR